MLWIGCPRRGVGRHPPHLDCPSTHATASHHPPGPAARSRRPIRAHPADTHRARRGRPSGARQDRSRARSRRQVLRARPDSRRCRGHRPPQDAGGARRGVGPSTAKSRPGRGHSWPAIPPPSISTRTNHQPKARPGPVIAADSAWLRPGRPGRTTRTAPRNPQDHVAQLRAGSGRGGVPKGRSGAPMGV
jgi:hypothetical protein